MEYHKQSTTNAVPVEVGSFADVVNTSLSPSKKTHPEALTIALLDPSNIKSSFLTPPPPTEYSSSIGKPPVALSICTPPNPPCLFQVFPLPDLSTPISSDPSRGR